MTMIWGCQTRTSTGRMTMKKRIGPKNTKEVIPKYLIFVKGVLGSDDLLTLNFNRETPA